ncbi:Gp138 family membrane-puncturing spike protein [Serratia liquefaciens]|uniref:Gp138 family membrane-puncturing spike protein n=1 Tax=Serratia liquefaciens TaxID=614 RepID=UPI0039067349
MADIRPANEQDVAKGIADRASLTTRVAAPGVIQSFDPDEVTATIQIGNMGNFGQQSIEYPLLVDVPVVFPRGGGCTLTFPVKKGDECLVIFSDRCIDFWWQSGSVQERVDTRCHDLSDAFAIVGPQSQAKKISGISTSSAQLRTDDGTAFVEVAEGGDITATTQGIMTVNAPNIILNGAVTINGPLTQGKGEAGGTATLLGPLGVDNDVTAAGISLQNHTHSGVQSGSNNTGKPQ